MSLSNNFPAVRPTLLLDFASARRLDPRITFTRASPAVYYDGVTKALAEQNLLLQSQTFDLTWGPTGVTVTANTTTAPDGTATADTITETAISSNHLIAQGLAVTSGLSYVFSVFVKKGTGSAARNFVQLALSTTPFGGNSFANFDIVSGTVTLNGGGVTSPTITSVGSGWWRCSIVDSPGSTASASFWVAGIVTGTDGVVPTYLGDVNANMFIWGAQLEQRAAVTAYTATTTSVVSNYIPVLVTAPAGVARFDFNPVTDVSLGLLIEEPRTNLALYSADFSNASWAKVQSSITSNTIVAPDGTVTGDKLIANTVSGQHRLDQTPVSSAGAQTFSVFVKAAEYTFVGLRIGGLGAGFNLTTGVISSTVTSSSASITPVGNNWFRCSITVAAASANDIARINITESGSISASFVGNDFSGIYIWGAQLEAGSSITSYIATVATTQTRNADSAAMLGSNFTSWFNPNEGTIYANIISGIVNGGRVFQAINTASTGNEIRLRAVSAMQLQITVDSVTAPSIFPNGAYTNFAGRFAAVYKTNDFAITVNGNDISGFAVSTTGVLPSNLNALYIGSFTGTATFVNGSIAKIAYYDVRLTNAQIQTLTQP
jgi:hypothetical protein